MSIKIQKAYALTAPVGRGLFLFYGALQVPRLQSRVSKAER